MHVGATRWHFVEQIENSMVFLDALDEMMIVS